MKAKWEWAEMCATLFVSALTGLGECLDIRGIEEG